MTSCSYSLAFFLTLTLLRLRFVERVAWFMVQMEDERCVTLVDPGAGRSVLRNLFKVRGERRALSEVSEAPCSHC